MQLGHALESTRVDPADHVVVQAENKAPVSHILFWTIGYFKRTVARDFLASVFFMDLLYVGLRLRGKKDFLFIFVFAKLFEYFDESAL